jgi:hypothetical protein
VSCGLISSEEAAPNHSAISSTTSYRGGFSPVIAVAAPDEAATASVLDALIEDARSGASAALYGRVEPRLLEAVARRRAVFRYAGGALVHASDPAIRWLAVSRHAMLTKLEGEAWMAPQLGAEVYAR